MQSLLMAESSTRMPVEAAAAGRKLQSKERSFQNTKQLKSAGVSKGTVKDPKENLLNILLRETRQS